MCEYVMSKAMYVALIREIGKGKRLGNPKEKVIEYLNQTAGVRGGICELRIEG